MKQRKRKKGRPTLLSDKHCNRIQHIIVAREGRNCPMTQKEVLEVILSVAACTTLQANNYFIYATTSNKFDLLQHSEKVCLAQKTTTSHTQVTIKQQHCWHTNIDCCWEKQKEMNLPADEFK